MLFDDKRCEAVHPSGMRLTFDSYVLEELLKHATSAGTPDDSIPDALGDHIDAIVHGRTEIHGRARVLAGRDTAGPGDRTYRGSLMALTTVGGAS
jgi:hypothetical protein